MIGHARTIWAVRDAVLQRVCVCRCVWALVALFHSFPTEPRHFMDTPAKSFAVVGLARRGVRRLVVVGGETSGAVFQTIDIKQLRIGAPIEPGAAPTPMWLALKFGNFGSVDWDPMCGTPARSKPWRYSRSSRRLRACGVCARPVPQP